MKTTFFERYEKKYLLTAAQATAFRQALKSKIRPDTYAPCRICNLYADTPNYQLIRHSLERPVYKEKLRLRTYSLPDENTPCFLELKKKFNGIVYKRRIETVYSTAFQALTTNFLNDNRQVAKEITYFIKNYGSLLPTAAIFYNRTAFIDLENQNLRYTFDENITARDHELDLRLGDHGWLLLPQNTVLLELKTNCNFPLWLTEVMNDLKIFPTRFSKYGTLYQEHILPQKIKNGGIHSA